MYGWNTPVRTEPKEDPTANPYYVPEKKAYEVTGERRPQFAVGDIVSTDFAYGAALARTVHRVVARRDGVSQTGVVYRVSPPVPKSGGPMAWLDEAWFQLVRKAGE